MVSNVELFAQLAAQGGLNLQQYAIQVFTFVPDSSGYVVVLHKGDRSLTRCAWHNVPAGLDQLLEREAANGVRHVTAGMNGSYVVILNSGVVWWKGVPPTLNKLLDDAEKSGRGVKVKRCNFLLVAVDRELTRRSFFLRPYRSPLSPRTGFSSNSSTGRRSSCCPHNGTAPSTNTPPKTCASKFRRWSLRSLPPRRRPTLRRLPTLRGSDLTAHSARSIHPTPLPSFTHPTLVLSFIHPIPLLSIIRPILLPSIIRPILLPSIIHPIPAPSMGMHLTRRIPTYNRMPVYHSSCHNHHHRHRHNNTNKRSTSPTCITPSSSQKNRPIIQAALYNY